MTSTITAESRASALQTELVEASRLPPRQVSWIWDDAVSDLIASAIRQAEDAALERIALALDEQGSDILHTRWGVAAKRFAADARRLKSPSPPKDQGHE